MSSTTVAASDATTRPGPYVPPSHLATPRQSYKKVLRQDPCSYCMLRPSKRGRGAGTVDHIEARANGGSHALGNLTGACPACNSEKTDRSLLLFLLDRVEQTR